MRRLAVLAAAALLSGCGDDAPRDPAQDPPQATPAPAATATAAPEAAELPAPDGRLPATARGIAASLAEVRPPLREAARAWDGAAPVPRAVTLLALRDQRLVLRLSERPRLVDGVLAALPARERADVRAEVRALLGLHELSKGWPVKRRFETQEPAPAEDLLRWYRRARERFGVPVPLLAAVNSVESVFGRLRNDSVAGAQGPMQFIPATWAAYGMGGDVQDPRDAIMGAANYLRANGSPGDNPRALYHYNPSSLYVRAVRRFARLMRTPARIRAFYARQVFVRAAGGGHRRITGPGRS
jgi:soluble lytic murein transglycosylase-like protein